MDTNATLAVIDGANTGDTVALTEDRRYTIGRSDECDLPLDDTNASRIHARLFRRDDYWFVEDLGSVNGTYVNGKLHDRLRLTNGDVIAVGDQKIRFDDDNSPDETNLVLEAIPVTPETEEFFMSFENSNDSSKTGKRQKERKLKKPRANSQTKTGKKAAETADLKKKKSAKNKVDLSQLPKFSDDIVQQIKRIHPGVETQTRFLLQAIVAKGHCIVEGMSGINNVRFAQHLAAAMSLTTHTIHCCDDMTVEDIFGVNLFRGEADKAAAQKSFNNSFANVNLLVVNQIDQLPAKPKMALIELAIHRKLLTPTAEIVAPDPFILLATRDSKADVLGQPLTPAQTDAFMFSVPFEYPNSENEEQLLRNFADGVTESIDQIIDGKAIVQLQTDVRHIIVHDRQLRLAAKIVRSTRPGKDASTEVNEAVEVGASTNTSRDIVSAARARAALNERSEVISEDIVVSAFPVLRHRVFLKDKAKSSGISSILQSILKASS